MIAVEFAVFVISSGVFYSERFRKNLYAVIAAGALAAGSSLLFFWHLGERMLGKPETPPIQIVHKFVEKKVPVLPADSDPAMVGTARNCRDFYPFWSRMWGDEGVTRLAFTVLADGTVHDVKVTQGSGSDRMDAAAVECVSTWHYRPALRKGVIAAVPWAAEIAWGKGKDEPKPDKPADPQEKSAEAP